MLAPLVDYLANVPPSVATLVLATLPIGELRGALPVALLVYKLPVLQAVVLALIGNILPVYFLMVFFEGGAGWLRRRSLLFDRFLTLLFERTRQRLDGNIKKYGYWALALFVAVPLPVTGAWTGTLAAFVFGLPKRESFLAILLGLIISATIVTLLTLGASLTVKSLL